MKKIDISVTIPLRNEEKNIWPLYKTIKETLLPLQKSYEIIFIDDGSTDNSFKLLKKIFDENTDNFTIISFRGKYGKSAAIACGFKKACGDIIFTLDADLQDDTQYIKPMLSKLSEGYDLVCGWRAKRKDPLLKVLLSRIFNITISFASGIKIHDFNCGFKAYKKEVTKELRLYGDLHRYIPVLVHWKNFKVTELKIAHHPRKFGKTKYGKERITGGFLDFLTVMFLTKYYEKPSRFFGASGIVFSGLGFLIMTVINKDNVSNLNHTIQLAKKYKCGVKFQPIAIHPEDKLEDTRNFFPSRKDFSKAIDWLIKQKEKGSPIVSSKIYLEKIKKS